MGRAAALGASSLAISTMLASADAFAAETPRKGGVLQARPRRRQHDRQHRRHLLQRLGDDRHRPRPVRRHRRMGPGRQAAPGSGRELGAEERREGLDFQSPQGDQVLERPGVHRRRRHLLAEPAPRRHQVRRRQHIQAGHRHQEARQVSDPDFAERAGRGPALCAHRLSRGHRAGWLQGLGQAGRDRRLQPRQVRSGRAHLAQEDARLLEGRRAAISTAIEVTVINDGSARLNALISGQIDAINRVDHKAVALLSKSAEDPDRARARRLACGDGDAMRQGALTTIRTSAWR